MQKVALVILDGFGINTRTPEENAIVLANTPTFDQLFSQHYAEIQTCGKAVGLPDGQMGNSEVGHMTIGTGRITKQPFVEIDDMFANGSFGEKLVFKNCLEHVRKNKSNFHLLQLFGPGGVHSTDHHLREIIKIIPSDIPTYLHLFGDGRDVAPQSALEFMNAFELFLKDYPHVKISTFGGRYFGMDRDNNWERIQKAYDEIVFQQTQTSDTPSEYIAKCYEAEKTDEFIPPVSFVEGEPIDDGDAVFFVNFRTDRARQLTQALVVSQFSEKASLYSTWGNGCITKSLNNIYLATMTSYYKEYDGDILLEKNLISNTLSEVISHHDVRQLHLAETEKYAHVTKFFNAEKDVVYDGQKNVLIPSHKVATFDLDPEMSAQEIYDVFEKEAQNFDVFIINYANGDMLGHTGVRPAIIQTVEKLDELTARMLKLSKDNDIDILLTADHGNCEEMGTPQLPKTSHTTNPVPLWYIHGGQVQKNLKLSGGLSDIAPTILDLLGIEKPEEMSGNSLIEK